MAPGFSSRSRHWTGGGRSQSGHFTPHFRPTRAALTAAATPRCWGLSIGVAGMVSQMRGLAEAAGFELELRRTRLKRIWHFLPLWLVPPTMAVVRDAATLRTDSPPPLLIACGRHSVIPAVCLKDEWGDRVFTVFVQNPLISPRYFDMVVAPEHDGITGDNVITTLGAMHHVTPAVLEAARQSELGRRLARPEQPIVTVLLGGPNRCYGFGRSEMVRLAEKLRMVVDRDGAFLNIISSRRTPETVRAYFAEAFPDHFVWDGGGENPYLAALAVADFIVVTCDSVSMTSEASATRRPVFVERLTERLPATRFRRFQDAFRRAGITRPFEGRLEKWTYIAPDETARVGRLIREAMGLPARQPNASEAGAE